MEAFWTSVAGICLIAWTLREIFMDLFQPSGSGSLSSFIAKQLFRMARHMHWMMRSAGPLSIVVVITTWALLVTVGFALVYWARFPQAFTISLPGPRDKVGKGWVVLYFSLASLTTLASGEIMPNGSWIRLVAALESLIGISLVTASVTWIVLIYPALGRMRTLARRASTLLRAQKQTGVDVISGDAENLLGDLAESVMRTRIDFIHFPLIYYFHSDTEGASLANSLNSLWEFANTATGEKQPERVRLAATVLKIALADAADLLQKRFVPAADPRDPPGVFRVVAQDHLQLN
jgi:hypothetical protein